MEPEGSLPNSQQPSNPDPDSVHALPPHFFEIQFNIIPIYA
jgi:hypothetical protein